MTGDKKDVALEVLAALDARIDPVARICGAMTSLASLIWIAQAFAAASLIGDLVQGDVLTRHIVVFGLIFVGLGLVRSGIEAVAARRIFETAQAMVREQRQGLTDLASLASPFAGARPSSADVATLIANKLELLVPWATHFKVAAIKVRLVPLGILVAVLSQSWAAALILLACGPLIPLFMALVGYAARDAAEKQLAEQSSMNGLLLEWLNAGADIRIFNAEARTVDAFSAQADQLRVRTMAVLRIAFLSSTVLEFFAALGIALTAVYVGFSLLGVFHFGSYGPALSTTSGIFILLMVPDFFQPLRDLASAWHDRAAATAVAGEIALFRKTHQETILGRGEQSTATQDRIRIAGRGLAITLASGTVVEWPDFEIHQGDAIALTGPSGAGKSTLLGLLCGLVVPSKGSLLIGDTQLDDLSADAWRQKIGYVGQHPHLMNASLRRNLTLALRPGEQRDLDAALAAAKAGDIVAHLPRGLHERLGENGAGVSGGEARRLMLASAILAQREVIVADEPTADLDASTANAIIDTLVDLARQGKTLIVATHDPNLIQRMDRCIDLRRER